MSPYCSPLVKLPFQDVMQFDHDIYKCLLRQENIRKFLSSASEAWYSIMVIGTKTWHNYSWKIYEL